ncbi:hybrid sensor histidine kinase/response regulator transcription factor [Bacteroides faecis]|uniref:hybrid sensor histidine kinase/response regulator transcription factor n=1 Tax=Bacteroides faecis TaxID=674529 RepID=UPI000262DEAC|nr:two-component regulator propeller domain-containing protein [Bacteroides faecis]SDX78192.1 Two component regulator propeller [Bacteroides faecis MAJ27]
MKRTVRYTVLVLIAIINSLVITTSLYAVLPYNELHQLNMSNGLVDNIITCIYQDQDRFMWFGSSNGLSRYDGKQIRNFSVDNARMYVSDIKETSDDKLWVIANEYLYCFDRRKEKFVLPSFQDGKKAISVSAMEITGDSLFWIVKGGQLQCLKRHYKLVKGDLQIEMTVEAGYPFFLDEGESFSNLCASQDGHFLYLVTDKGNLLFFDKIAGKVVRKFKYSINPSANATTIMSEGEYIWVSSIVGGVTRLHIPTGKSDYYQYNEDARLSSLSHSDAYGVVALDNDSYIAVTWNGYTLLAPEENDPSKLLATPYTNTSFLQYRNVETRMISVYYDKEGILWIGTRGGGIVYFDFRQHSYMQYHSKKHNEISAQVADKDGRIWLGTYHEGIMRSDQPYAKSRPLNFSPVGNQKEVPVFCAIKDSCSNLWFGNASGNLICYDWSSDSFHIYPLNYLGKKVNSYIVALMIDSRYRFWVCTSAGLYLFDHQTGHFELFSLREALKEDAEPWVTAICEDKQRNIWIGTAKGIVRLSQVNVRPFKMVHGYEEKENIGARVVSALLTGTDGTVYVGYKNGFGIIPVGEDRITSFYTVKDGLCNDCIDCIVEDEKKRIWLGSISGISRYSRQQHVFYNYYISSSNKSVMLFKNTLFWGNNKSLTYFEPEILTSATIASKTLLTGLEVDNKQINIGEKIKGQVVLDSNIASIDHLELVNANRDFSLLFNNLAFSKDLQKYSYRLYPYQKDWIVSEAGKVSFTNLSAGYYIFEVKTLFPNNTEGDVTALPITILPHWSQTVWFRLLLIFSVLFLVGYIFYSLLRRQHRFKKMIQLKHELTIANLERNAERHIREERENFFMNAAHELRTPLTLILASIHDIMKSITPSDNWFDSFSRLHKNCLSLQTLVDRLLYVQKIEGGMIKLHLSESDIKEIVSRVANPFLQMAMVKKREFLVQVDTVPLYLWVDVAKIESAVQNLLSNAFKYTSQNGRIELAVSEAEIDGRPYCLVTVSDNGVGIPDDLQQHVFDSFVTGKRIPQYSTSIGLGLHIVKHTMGLHHGFVTLTSRVGEGSRFVLHIPVGLSHFVPGEYEMVPDPVKGDLLEECTTEERPMEEVIAEKNETMEETVNRVKNNKEFLLIIEDHDEMREYLCSLFKEDYNVIEAGNGEEGVAMADKYIPKLIISDIMMPVKDGFECSREIRENKRTFHIPVIFLTAKAEDADRLKSLQIGVDDYIMKPFNPELLKEKVKALIEQRDLLRKLYAKTLMLDEEVLESSEDVQDVFMPKMLQIIEENLSNRNFTIKVLTDQLNMSQPTLYRKVKQKTGLSIIEVIHGVRMSKAASIIMSRRYSSLTEVAEMVGYDSMISFRKQFVAQFGVLPSKYMEEKMRK